MNSKFLQRLQTLDVPSVISTLTGIQRGFEKESLRVDHHKKIAQTPHPIGLGSSLLHPRITTDYSEALLEFITPPSLDLAKPLTILGELHQFTYPILKNELLWTASMPCHISDEQDIPIAEYGHSNLAQLKNIYRRGLGLRYGRKMQAIAGIHYNFSLSNDFWKAYQKILKSDGVLSDFISEQYLRMIRNCFRFGWLLALLFGASSAVDKSFLPTDFTEAAAGGFLQSIGKDTLVGPYATSLRLSDLGYHNPIQASAMMSYDSFPEFLETLQKAVHTEVPEYAKKGVKKNGEYQQLSTNILQAEDEHYAMFRPKRVAPGAERMLAALQRDGIEYVEVRALDINPFQPLGVDAQGPHFLDAFLLFCLLQDSPPFTLIEKKQIASNQAWVAKAGRDPSLTLIDQHGKTRGIQEWASELLASIEKVASLLDKAYQGEQLQKEKTNSKGLFTIACQVMQAGIQNPEHHPSARVLQEMKNHSESYVDFAWRWSLQHQQYFLNNPLTASKADYYRQLAEDSLKAQKVLESEDGISFDEYLERFLSV